MPKTYTKQSQSGAAGIALIDQRVTAMGFIWHERQRDHGIDGEIELVDRVQRRPLNRTISVQSKARQRFPGEDDHGFHYICEPDDIEYWCEGEVPVVLVCSHPDTGECWWAPASELLRDPVRRRTGRIDFDKVRDRFDESAASSLLDLGAPATGNLFVPSMAVSERLTSNLLSVSHMPDTIWAAPAIVRNHGEAWDVLRQQQVRERDWMILDRTLFSFRRPDDSALACLIDGGAEAIDVSEWAEAKAPDTQRNFVRLLNQTLAEKHHGELRVHPKRHYLYFKATEDLLERRLATGKSKSGRVVFRAYPDERDPAEARHFRHHALDHQFVRLDGEWFLELNPTYHFTADGWRDLPWGAELVKGMKRREKNNAVRALVDLWARYLRGTHGLFDDQKHELLRFGDLVTFDVERGVDERAWAKARVTDPSSDDPTLFEAS